MDDTSAQKSLPLGFTNSANGTNVSVSELKRPKQGLEYHLLNMAALLAGVGIGGDVRYAGRSVPQPTPPYLKK